MDGEFTLTEDNTHQIAKTKCVCTVNAFYEKFVIPALEKNIDLGKASASDSYKILFSSGDIAAMNFFSSFELSPFPVPENVDTDCLVRILESLEVENQQENKRIPEKCEAMSNVIAILTGFVRYPQKLSELFTLMEDFLWKNMEPVIADKCKDGELTLEEYKDLCELSEKTGLCSVPDFREKLTKKIHCIYSSLRSENESLPDNLSILDVKDSVRKFVKENKVELDTEENRRKIFEKYRECQSLDDMIQGNDSRRNWPEDKWIEVFSLFLENSHISLKLPSRCPVCGHELLDDVSFCPLCGATIDTNAVAPVVKKRSSLLIMLIAILILSIASGCVFFFMRSREAESNVPVMENISTQSEEKAEIEMPDAEELFQTAKAFENSKNYSKALEYYQKAAKYGSIDSLANLGGMYFDGLGVVTNYQKAFEYYQFAAEKGDVFAQYNIGYMYENGFGVDKDINLAREWYQKAADQGDIDAQEALDRLMIE